MKIKSMPQLMNPQEQDREIEVFRRLSLGPRAYEEYYPYNNNTELAFTIGGQDVYVQKGRLCTKRIFRYHFFML